MPRLQFICEMKSLKERLNLLKILSQDDHFCKAIREIVRNTVKKNIRITDRDRKKLVKYRKVILALAEKQKGDKKKKPRLRRRLIHQTGTGVFLPIVIPLVFEILRGITQAAS